jgi:hypothetical protein
MDNIIEFLPTDIIILILNKLSHQDIIKLLKLDKFFNNFIKENIKYINPIVNNDNDDIYIITINDNLKDIDNIILKYPKIGLSKRISGLYYYWMLQNLINKYNYYIYKIDFPKFIVLDHQIYSLLKILNKCNNIKYINFSNHSLLDLPGNNKDNNIIFNDCYIDFSNCINLKSFNKINNIKLHNCILDLTNCPKFDISSLINIVDNNTIIKK